MPEWAHDTVYAPDQEIPVHPIRRAAISRKLNSRWWLVTYRCGAWRLMPAWYADDCSGTYCQVHGVRPGEHARTASIVPIERPGPRVPRQGEGTP